MKIVQCLCGNEVKTNRPERTKYCSKACLYKYRTRPSGLVYSISKDNKGWFKKGDNPWNKGKSKGWVDEGYRKIKINNKNIREHRKIMEDYLGYKLEDNQVVHHVDGDKLNNNLDNLEVMTRSEHTRLHKKICV